MIGMVIFAGAIELAQYSVAGRHARMSDFIVDATSACIGVISVADPQNDKPTAQK
jgi:VanZ family protein